MVTLDRKRRRSLRRRGSFVPAPTLTTLREWTKQPRYAVQSAQWTRGAAVSFGNASPKAVTAEAHSVTIKKSIAPHRGVSESASTRLILVFARTLECGHIYLRERRPLRAR